MNDELVKTLNENSTIKQLAEQISLMKLGSPVLAHHEDFKISSLEKHLDAPIRHRFKFQTPDINSYVDYCEEHADDMTNTTTFIDPDRMTANTVFDMGSPDSPMHRDHSACINLQKTVEYREVSLSSEVFCGDQHELVDWMARWSDYLTFFSTDNEEEMTLAEALRFAKNLTVGKATELNSVIDDYSGQMSSMEKIEASTSGKMVKIVRFTCVPYLGIDPISVDLKPSILSGSENLKILLTNVKLDSIKAHLSKMFLSTLEGYFNDRSIDSKFYISTN